MDCHTSPSTLTHVGLASPTAPLLWLPRRPMELLFTRPTVHALAQEVANRAVHWHWLVMKTCNISVCSQHLEHATHQDTQNTNSHLSYGTCLALFPTSPSRPPSFHGLLNLPCCNLYPHKSDPHHPASLLHAFPVLPRQTHQILFSTRGHNRQVCQRILRCFHDTCRFSRAFPLVPCPLLGYYLHQR